jgi:hypothetical protein
MGILADCKMYGRFAGGLRGFLRHTITREEAKAIVQRFLSGREANSLGLVEKGIFDYPRIPYLPMKGAGLSRAERHEQSGADQGTGRPAAGCTDRKGHVTVQGFED